MILRYERGGARSTWGWTLFSSTSSARGRGCYCGEWKIFRRWSWGLSRKSDWIKNPKSGASAERAQTSGCNQHPDCVPWALPLWTLQSLSVGARCVLIFLICNSFLSRQDWWGFPDHVTQDQVKKTCTLTAVLPAQKLNDNVNDIEMFISINAPLWYFKY